MPRLSDLQPPDIREIPLTIAGEECLFEVDLNAFTIGWERRFRRAAGEGDVSAVADTFFSLVKGWDITDDDDNVLPMGVEAVDMLSIGVFTQITQLLMEKIDPNEVAPAAKKQSRSSRRR